MVKGHKNWSRDRDAGREQQSGATVGDRGGGVSGVQRRKMRNKGGFPSAVARAERVNPTGNSLCLVNGQLKFFEDVEIKTF